MSQTDVVLRDALATRLQGQVLTLGDPGFDEARTVWNARFVRTPALIARCETDQDVAGAIGFARERGLEISVKGGGHDYAGNTVAQGSLLLDLGTLRAVVVDVASRRVRVGAGCTWREVDEATSPHGLAASGGTVSSVGVAGLTLGGGAGWLARVAGLAVDNLIRARVVTAEGETLIASADEHPDLFWALRGGGGNFGVVTEFEIALHSISATVHSGQVIYPGERAAELLRFYRDTFRNAPDALMCFPFLLRIPPLDIFPAQWHGMLAFDFVLAWFGDPEEAAAHIAPFQALGDPILNYVVPQPYTQLQQSFDAAMGKGNRWYSRAQQFDALTDDAIDTLVAHLDPFPGDFTTVYLAPGGGAVGRVAVDATAYPHRGSAHELHIFPGWAHPSRDAEVMAWADALHAAMRPHGNGAVYVNLLGDGEPDRIQDAYQANYRRLSELKAKWDPQNVFKGNHNIPPAG
jgi:FAD/FMN-containing dehydrogenase